MKVLSTLLLICMTIGLSVFGGEKVSDWGTPVNGLRMRVHYSDTIECYEDPKYEQGINTYLKIEVENISNQVIWFTPSSRLFLVSENETESRSLQFTMHHMPNVTLKPGNIYNWYQHALIKYQEAGIQSFIFRGSDQVQLQTGVGRANFVLLTKEQFIKNVMQTVRNKDCLSIDFSADHKKVFHQKYLDPYYTLTGKVDLPIMENEEFPRYDFGENVIHAGGSLVLPMTFQVTELLPYAFIEYCGPIYYDWDFIIVDAQGEVQEIRHTSRRSGFRVGGTAWSDYQQNYVKTKKLIPRKDYYCLFFTRNPWHILNLKSSLSSINLDSDILSEVGPHRIRTNDLKRAIRDFDNKEFTSMTDWSSTVGGLKMRICYEKSVVVHWLTPPEFAESQMFFVKCEILNVSDEKKILKDTDFTFVESNLSNDTYIAPIKAFGSKKLKPYSVYSKIYGIRVLKEDIGKCVSFAVQNDSLPKVSALASSIRLVVEDKSE